MKSLFLLLTLVIIAPAVVFANGGDQRVVEDKYLINLSRAPFTPRVGIKTAMLVSFVDLKKDTIIKEDLIIHIGISKLSRANKKREFIFEKNSIKVNGGILEFSYTFPEAGLHEIFFDFALTSNPQKIYEAPDFLLDVQEPLVKTTSFPQIIIAAIAGIFFGYSIALMF